ncbi:MAG: glycosyltransferase family 4 protein [Verrucomicrobia bacterium]|nr:glycosyltransferase family 4 protein [Verrucomicrobiota bacterium]
MRILFVHEKFGAFGGAEANVLATATELQERGHVVGLLHGPNTGKGEAAWLNTFQHRCLIGHGSKSATALAAWKQFQPDVLYVHKMSDLELLETLLDTETPIIRMVHDHDLYCMRSYKYNFFTRHICERALSPFCLIPCGAFVARNHDGALPVKWVSYSAKLRELELNRKFDRLVVATQFMADELLRNQFDANKIELHAPVPPNGDASWVSSFSDRNYIVYAGQIIRGKGVDVLLESLAQVRVPFTCLIFGDGQHREYCEKLSRKLELTDRVIFKGYVSPDEIALFYRECSVVAVSSVWPEPFGAVGLEAMRFGLPVVAFDAGGIREWLAHGQNGFLVPWMDRPAFARRVEELLGDKTLARQMGERGRQLVAEQYGFSEYISGLENLFERAVERPVLAVTA